MAPTKFSGRQFNIGIAKETVRGTPVAAAYWLQYETLTIDDEIKVAKNEANMGVIEKGIGQDITSIESKGTINGNITDLSFGLLLKSIMGTDTPTVVETTANDHKFTVLQTAQHPSLTVSVYEPNSNSGTSGYAYPLSVIDELEMTFEVGKYSKFKANFMGNKGANLAADTVSYVSENLFRPQDGVFKLATNLAGLGAASAINITKAVVTLKQNSEADIVIGNTSPVDRLNKEFEVSGSLELKYFDRSMIDTYLLADLAQAASFTFINAGVTIGASSHPQFVIRLAKVKFESVARKVDLKGIVTQTVKFNAFYSLSDTEMLDITLRNTLATGY